MKQMLNKMGARLFALVTVLGMLIAQAQAAVPSAVSDVISDAADDVETTILTYVLPAVGTIVVGWIYVRIVKKAGAKIG